MMVAFPDVLQMWGFAAILFYIINWISEYEQANLEVFTFSEICHSFQVNTNTNWRNRQRI